VLVPLEHHVLEHVRESAPPRRIVLRADVIPNLDGHDGRIVVFDGVNFEAVRQREMLELHRRNANWRFGRRIFRASERGKKHQTKGSGSNGKFHESPIP
jgi:hypothetical protein